MSDSTKLTCCFCRLPRASLECEVCHEDVCRTCVERLGEETFAMRSEVPSELAHLNYCPRCHDQIVAPAIETYNEIFERAKKVGYWPRTYQGHVPVLKKARLEVSVAGCRDQRDVLMKLGFLAAEQGYNGLIKGEITCRKVRNEGYQKSEWSGHAFPCHVDDEKLERAEFNEAHWRVIHHR